MFVNINLGGINFAFPDVCKIPPFAIPIPFPNITISFTHVPSQFKVIIGGGLAENLLTPGTVSLGDMAGILGGVVSQVDAMGDLPIMGSFKTLFGPVFATRLTSLNMQNLINIVGVTITPSQVKVLVVS